MAEFQTELAEQAEDTQHGRYLMFALDNEDFGIEIKYVTEIIGMQPIMALPEVPEYFKGVINLRGKIIPVIDIRLKFKKDPIDYTDRTCIIVIDTDSLCVGLIVDNVAEVVGIEDENIVPPPPINTGTCNKYMQGIGKLADRISLLLDCRKLFLDEEIQILTNIN